MKILRVTLIFFCLLTLTAAVFAQDGERRQGIELFNKGSFKESVAVLEKVVKAQPGDAEARTFLGMSQLKLGKVKDAEKTLLESLEIDANQPNARKALAYVYLLRGKLPESVKQMEALKLLSAMDAESFYILGLAYLRLDKNELALQYADDAIRLDPKYANPYLVKAHAIMNRWDNPKDYKAISAKYGSSAENIGKFITLSSQLADAPFWRGQQETLQIFANYYAEREKAKSAPEDGSAVVTPLKVLAKPRAEYPAEARRNGVGGIIRLLVAFSETGRIKDVVALTSLGYGLDEAAVRAAKSIKYEPEMRDGKPVLTVKTVEYVFTIY